MVGNMIKFDCNIKKLNNNSEKEVLDAYLKILTDVEEYARNGKTCCLVKMNNDKLIDIKNKYLSIAIVKKLKKKGFKVKNYNLNKRFGIVTFDLYWKLKQIKKNKRGVFMRFYGVRSGRNKTARLLARSYMFNQTKTNNKSLKDNDCEWTTSTFVIAVLIALFLLIIFGCY